MEARTVAPFFFRNNPQRERIEKNRINRALRGPRRFAVEQLEPRVLLSADTVLNGVTDGLANGLAAVGTEIGQLLDENPVFNTYVPGIVEQRTVGTETRELSPTFGEAMSISTDVAVSDASSTYQFNPTGKTLADRWNYLNPPDIFTGLGGAYTFYGNDAGDEAAMRAMDVDGDGQLSVDEAFDVLIVGRLQAYLADPGTIITDQDGVGGVTVTDLGIQVADFLEGADLTLTDRFQLTVHSVSSSVKNDALTWDADITVDLMQKDRFDLGYEADKLGIILDPGTPPNPNPDPFKVQVFSSIDFGSLQFGFTGVGDAAVSNNDFFFAAPDKPSDSSDGVRAGVSIGEPGSPVAALIGMNIGFLGAHAINPGSPTGVVLDMDVVGSAVDPSNVDALGFTAAQQGVENTSGTIEAAGDIDETAIANTAIQFTLKIGKDSTHAETELALPQGTATPAIVGALNTAIGGSNLAGLVTASDGDSDGHVEFTVVSANPGLLGFSNEQLAAGEIVGGSQSSLIGVGKSPTVVKLLVSVNGTWKLLSFSVTIDADGADNASGTPATDADNNAITALSLKNDLQAALDAAFGGGVATASFSGAPGSQVLHISGPGNIEISKTLTLDTLERITLSELTGPSQIFEITPDGSATFNVDLTIKADAGLEKQDNSPYRPQGTIKVDLDPFTPNAVKKFVVDTIPGTTTEVVRADYLLTDSANHPLKDGASDMQKLLDFNVINVADILGTFSEIGTWFERLTGTDLLQGFDLPFGNTVLGNLLNFKDLITDSFLIDDLDNGAKAGTDDVEKLLKWVGETGKEKLVAMFGNAQQLEDRLNTILGLDVDGTVFDDADGRQNLTYNVSVADVELDIDPNVDGAQPLTIPLDFELNLDPFANFVTSGKLQITGKGDIGFTVGVILGNAVEALVDSSPLLDLNSGAGVKLNTNLALTSTSSLTPLVGRISQNASFDITVAEGATVNTYTVNLLKANTDNNTTITNLKDDINAALAASSATLASKVQAVVEPIQGSTASAKILLVATAGSVTRLQTTVSTGNVAYTELGMRTQSAYTVALVAPKPIPSANPAANFNFTVTVDRGGTTTATLISFTTTDTADNVSLQSLLDDLNAKLPSGIVASQSGGVLVLAAIDSNIDSFSVTDADKLGLDVAAANELLFAAGVATLPTEIIAGVELRGGAAPSDPFGRLQTDPTFTINGNSLTIDHNTTSTNTSTDDLVRSINAKIEADADPDLKGKIAAINDGGRIAFRAIDISVHTITLADISASESTALGIANGTSDGALAIHPVLDAPVSYGVSSDVAFKVTINGTDFNGTLTRDNTILNRSLFDLAASLNNAINAAVGGSTKNPLIATVQSGQIVIGLKTSGVSTNLIGDPSTTTAVGGIAPSAVTSFSINSSNSKFATELKLISAANVANNASLADFVIYFRDGSTPLAVSLDSLDTDGDQKLDATLGDLKTAIMSAPGAAGRITVDVNSDGTSLKLIDNTAGSNLFRVVGVNGSPAAAQLGILGSDTTNLNVGEVPVGAPAADGIIDGGKIATVDLRDRLYLKDAGASAELTIKTKGTVEAEATFGFVGIKVSSSADQELFKATAELPIIDDQLSLRDLFTALGSPSDLLALVGDPTLTLAGDFSFDVSTFPSVDPSLIGGAGSAKVKFHTDTVQITLADQLPGPDQLFPDLGITIEPIDFGDLLKFDQIKFDDIIAAFQAIAKFLSQFQSFQFLDEKIPVLGKSVNDLINLADDFQDAVNEFQDNPAGGIQVLAQKLQEGLGLPNFADAAAKNAFFNAIGIDPTTASTIDQLIEFALDGDVLKFNLRLPVGFNKGLNVDLDLGDALGTGNLVDIQGGANLNAHGFLDARLSFGIDLSDPTHLLIYDADTSIEGGLFASADNVQFNAAIGPLGVFVKDGGVHLSLNAGVTVGDGNPTPELIDLADLSTLTDFLDTLAPTVSGSVDATLPVYFPSASEYFGDITFAAGFDLTGDDLEITSPDLHIPDLTNIDLSSLNPFNSIPQMLDALDFFLSGVQDIMDGQVFGIDLPLIGDQLKGAADFIEDLRRDVLGPIRTYTEQAPALGKELVQKLIFSLLGPGSAGVMVPSLANPAVQVSLASFLGVSDFTGLNLLKDYDSSDGETNVTFEDVVASEVDNNFQWLFRLGQSFKPNVNIDFDLGIPALSLDMNVGLDVTIQWDLAIGVGIGPEDGAYIFIGDQRGNDPAGHDELQVSVEVDLTQQSDITGNLGFLQLEINESDTADPALENSGPGQRNTYIAAQFGVDLKNSNDANDDKLSFSELGSLTADVNLSAEAEVNLDVVARFNPDIIPDTIQALLPEVSARFVLDFETGDIFSGDFDFGSSLSLLGFRDVEIDMGSFINQFLKPFVDKIAEVTGPLQPIIDVITAPIPVISDLAGQPISLVDIAGMTGYVEPAMIYAIADIISLVNKISGNSYDKFTVPLGDFMFIDTGGQSLGMDGDAILDPSYSFSTDAQFDKGALDATVAAAKGAPLGTFDSLLAGGSGDSSSKDLVSGLKSGTESGSSGFAFPLFDDPSLIFGLLLGKDIPIVTYDLAPFGMDFSYTQKFPVWDALFVRIGGSVGLTIDLAFGYDTAGVRKFAEGGFSNPLDLLAGFYVSDTASPTGEGTDVPELVLKGELFAGAELNLGIASAGAEGAIGLITNFDLYDPNSDGKVRIDELVGNFLYEFKYGSPLLAPIAIFDVTGQIYAQLRAFVEALFFKYEFEITPKITLFEFSIPFEREPFLATERGDGSLLLNIGPNSAQRLNGDTRDGDETVYVKSLSATEVAVWNGTTVREGDAQTYHVDPTKGIFGYGGEGNDTIDLSQVTHNIVYTLEGGVGDDIIKGSAGGGSMKGDAGNDQLTGGDGVDYIYGGEGNDTIDGKGGADFIFGDTGIVRDLNDETYDPNLDPDTTEDPFGDRLRSFVGAQDGDDNIKGGGGNDVIFGGGGNDTIQGEGGDDIIIGDGGNFDRQAGNLILLADGRPDVNARGAGGKDTIFGNDGNDVIFGGASDDLIDGGANHDEIDGGSGFDTIYGGSDADTIYGGLDGDIIFGFRDPQGAFFSQPGDTADVAADGIDTIFGEDGNDYIRGNDGNDILHGGAGADILFGDKGNDHLYGEADSDTMFGGADDDFVDGSDGADIAFGDDGLVVWIDFSTTATTFDFTGSRIRYVDGDGDGKKDQLIGDSDKTLRDAYQTLADSLSTSLDLIVTKTLGSDGSDTIIGGDGNDIVFGGGGTLDKLFGDYDPTAGFSGPRPNGQDILIGDGGRIEWDTRRIERAAAESGGFDGNDNISGNDSGDYIFGGGFNDNIHGFQSDATQPLAGVSENDVVLGDNGEIKFDISDAKNRIKSINTTVVGGDSGRSDIIDGDFGNDIVFGGQNGSYDIINGDVGDDILLGDNGEIRFDLDGDFDTLDKIESYADGTGGTDNITGFDGNDVLIGGTDADIMAGNNGEDILLGDNARIDVIGLIGRLMLQVAAMPVANSVDFITTTDILETTGGADVMSGNAADDILFGGVNNGGPDVMYGDSDTPVNAQDGNDILVGDNGSLDFTQDDLDRNTVDLIKSFLDGLGGSDTISGNAGSDIALGGTGGDTIYGDNATASAGALDLGDILLGDNGEIHTLGNFGAPAKLKALGTGIETIKTTDLVEATGGIDTISGNAGADVILGGVAGDIIYGDASSPVNALDGNDVLLGDDGELDFADDRTLALLPAADDLTTLDRITSYLDAKGGSDTISGNAGADTEMGGTAGDIMYGDNATASGGATDLADIQLGDNGEIILVNPALDGTIPAGTDRIVILGGAVASIKTAFDTLATGGADTISGNAGGDIALGGVYGDTIYGDRATVTGTTNPLDGNDILLGDNGALEWLSTGRLGEITGINVTAENPGLVAGFSVRDANLDTLDLITTEQPNSGGRDTIFGDNGRDTIMGGTDLDLLHGDSGFETAGTPDDGDTTSDSMTSTNGNDLMFGDHGRLYPQFSTLASIYSRNFFAINVGDGDGGEGDKMWGEEGDDIMLGQQGDDRMWGGSGDDDMIGGHNVSGGYDELTVPAVQDKLDAISMNDFMDGDSGNDSMAGDNAVIWRRGDDVSPWFRALTAATIYTTTASTITTNVGGTAQSDPNDVVGRDLRLLDHDDSVLATPLGRFGSDVMAGGAGNDEMFGELGDDLMQGDGAIQKTAVGAPYIARTLPVTDSFIGIPDTDETLYFNIPEAATDGDDYMEGNGGSDLMYGGLGQDDMIGGSSELFGLTLEIQRPDAGDIIFGGAGIDITRNDLGDAVLNGTPKSDGSYDYIETTATGHARDADYIMGDNADIFRLVKGDASDAFLTFNYDNYGALKIVPRAMKQLDYHLGGADFNPGTYENGAAKIAGVVDNGAADIIHGESGDDIIFGMVGSDVLFGEGQDDDIIGGYGNDWISGGTGQDGVLGDDGLIYTSRNSTIGEPLYGIAGLLGSDPSTKYSNGNALDETISTPGDIQIAQINGSGNLKKTVDLVPFSYDPNWLGLDDEYPDNQNNTPFADDIIFGGLNSDWLHGGSGDDAILGGEALNNAYVPVWDASGNPIGILDLGYSKFQLSTPINPGATVASLNPGDVLNFNPIDVNGQHLNNRFRAGEFFLYDEYDPLRKIQLDGNGNLWKPGAGAAYDFLLDFNTINTSTEGVYRPGGTVPKATGQQTETYGPVRDDGTDAIFGDNGNDWLVGGTGRDDMYGGWGNDLLNADDEQTTNGNLNDQPDTHPTYEDRAYGGAGRDVLIANTGGDRLIDWVGEYNSYLVPFAPFGEATVSRTLQPFLPEYLYALSSGDGADPTRYADAIGGAPPAPTNNNPNPSRNGEPFGELGLVLQKDFAWQDQTGAPSDPQAGNIPGGPRDVLRSAGFNDGAADAFFVDSGTWSVSNGAYQVAPAALGLDAVSVFYVDQYIPNYFEVLATLSAGKPTGGYKSNAYVIFDYQSENDFKFAGINVSTNKLEIGHRNESGWFVDKQGAVTSSLKSDQNYNVFLSFNGTVVTMIVDNTYTLSFTYSPRVDFFGISHGFNDGMVGLGANNSKAKIDNVIVQRLQPATTLSKTVDFSSGTTSLFDAPISGTWLVSGGRYDGTAAGTTPAIDTVSFNVGASAMIDLSAKFKVTGEGGFIYDEYAINDFKFVTISAGKITLGHRTAKGWFTDAVINNSSIVAGTDYTLGITLKGTTVSVTLNGSLVASRTYNAVVTDGNFGLLSRTGTTSFDTVTVKSDDPSLLNATFALTADSATPASSESVTALTDSQLATVANAAIQQWSSVLPADQKSALSNLQFLLVTDLPGDALAWNIGDGIMLVDMNAAGRGWFTDSTPFSNSEYRNSGSSLLAKSNSAADGHEDLLTALIHEIGHTLGYTHSDGGAMNATLATGEREVLIDWGKSSSNLSGLVGWNSTSTSQKPNFPEFKVSGGKAKKKSFFGVTENTEEQSLAAETDWYVEA